MEGGNGFSPPSLRFLKCPPPFEHNHFLLMAYPLAYSYLSINRSWRSLGDNYGRRQRKWVVMKVAELQWRPWVKVARSGNIIHNAGMASCPTLVSHLEKSLRVLRTMSVTLNLEWVALLEENKPGQNRPGHRRQRLRSQQTIF